jgi:hypothetical protein
MYEHYSTEIGTSVPVFFDKIRLKGEYMDVSRGRCLLKPLREARGWSQSELSRRTGYDPTVKFEDRTGISPRMISHFEEYGHGLKDKYGKDKGKPMSPEAMYLISRLLELPCMDALYEWKVIGAAE